jgi:ATP-dependent Clp protease ATP-binding subunit ClpC
MEGNFSNRVQDVIRLSREEALRLGHDYIGTEHLLLGVIREGEGIAVKILRNLGVDLYKLKKADLFKTCQPPLAPLMRGVPPLDCTGIDSRSLFFYPFPFLRPQNIP